jgi:hypothetical protein
MSKPEWNEYTTSVSDWYIACLPEGQPIARSEQGYQSALSKEVHQWFIDQDISYELKYYCDIKPCPIIVEFIIVFKSKYDALLFKLTWGGKV